MTIAQLNFPILRKHNKTKQITDCIRQFIYDGVLKAGNKLPATRTLASELNVARGTIVVALEILIAEGMLVSRGGSGTYVADELYLKSSSKSDPMFYPLPQYTVVADVDKNSPLELNFQVCRPSLEAFPRTAWRKAAAQAASVLPLSDYGNPKGELTLRKSICSYLLRARGLNVNTDEIIITNGAIQAMQILASIYLSKDDEVIFEEPGYSLARQVFTNTGAQIRAVAVDGEGLNIEDLPNDGGQVKLIYITPSHQFPTGARLSMTRRCQLLAWAATHNVLILEDDYDGEFRYDISPLPPLASICAMNHVAYLGTFSKTLFPALRIGFAVAPREIINEMAAYKTLLDCQTNQLSQLTLHNFIDTGEYEKHIQRMRRIYAQKRQCLKQAITDYNFPGQLKGIDSGLNAMVVLEPGLSARKISECAAQINIAITPVSRFCCQPNPNDNALIVGYSALSLEQIKTGIKQLSALIRSEITNCHSY